MIVTIYNNGDRSRLEHHEAFSSFSIASRLLASILLRWLFSTRKSCMCSDEAGFYPDRGYFDQILTLPEILERKRTFHRFVNLSFLIWKQFSTHSVVPHFSAASHWRMFQRNSFHSLDLCIRIAAAAEEIATMSNPAYEQLEFCECNRDHMTRWCNPFFLSGKSKILTSLKTEDSHTHTHRKQKP